MITAHAAAPTRVRWVIFALACATSWFLYLHRYTWNFVGPELKREFGYNNEQVGWLVSCFNAAYGIGQIPSGILCDLFGAHLLLGIMIVTWSLLTAVLGLSGAFPFLAGQRVLFGAAQAGTYPILSKVSHSWFPLRIRTTLQGWIASFFGRSGGAMSSIIMATILMGWLGLTWQSSLAAMGLAGLALGAAFLVLFRNSPVDDPRVNDAERELIQVGSPPPPGYRPRLPWRKIFSSRSLLFVLVMQFMAAGADTVYSAFIGDYFLNAKGFNMAKAGALASLPLWGGAVGGMLGGVLNDVLIATTGSRRWARSIVGGLAPVVAAGLLFVVIRQHSGLAAALALFAVKFFVDMGQPTVWGTCTDLAGRYSATVFSIVNTSGTIGGLFCPILFGIILDRNTTKTTVEGLAQSVTDYNPLFLTVAGMYLLAGVCWLVIDCTRSVEDR
jgi:MFS transporter, ACS family, glucarate transporter